MPRIKFDSKYYAEDKDVYDLLKGSPLTFKRLLKIARDRGIYISETESRDTVINYISELPFSWPQLSALMLEMESEDKEDKFSFLQIEDQASTAAFYQALVAVKAERASREETYNPSTTKDGKVELQVGYTEFAPNITRLKQKRHRDLKIEAEVKDGKLEVRFHSNKKAAEILAAVFDKLPQTAEKPLKKTLITLSGIKDPKLRTSFFESLWMKMPGLGFRDVKDVRVDRIADSPDLSDDEELETEDEELEVEGEEIDAPAEKKVKRRPKQEREFKSIVRRMAISGEGLHKSPQYLNLVKEGFFISKAIWVSREAAGKNRDLLLSAEFTNAEEAIGFTYDIRWVWERDEDGDLSKDKSPLVGTERKKLIEILEQTAVKTVAELNVSLAETAKTPPPPENGGSSE